MRHFNAVMAVLCLLLNTSCAEFEDPQHKLIPEEPKEVHSQSLADKINVQVQPTTKPEKYMIYFSWPKFEDDKRLRIRKEQILALVPPTQNTFSHEVEHDQTITYTFEVLNAASLVEKTFSKLVKVPKDFVVRKGQSELTEDQKISVKRIFLDREVPLRTNGHHIELIADEIIADKGIIETFPEGSKAQTSTDGRGAGELVIKAKSAAGQLMIIMRGQHGGDGLKGEAYPSRAADGKPPTSGALECECRKCVYSNPILAMLATSEMQPMGCFCTDLGADGSNGSPGAKGRTGGRAGNGGDSGNLKVEILDGSAFLLQTDSKVGFAGTPGDGGDGQLGGIAQGTKTRCSGKPGTNGPNGPKGDSGKLGENGKPGIICVYIATEGKNDCY